LHLGALFAVALAFLVYILLWRTILGYRIRAVGQNPHAARYAGIKVQRYVVLALLLSGAFSGLAGAVQVYGVNYRMITDGSASGFTGSAGFNGIVAALFGQLHPIWSIPASILFAAGGCEQDAESGSGPFGIGDCPEWFGGGLRGQQRDLAPQAAEAQAGERRPGRRYPAARTRGTN
jgi:ABC-type uncharacterized transport system permease subunit